MAVVEVGLYGKLPSHGDFLRRRTSEAFVVAWDTWLQECMTASRAALGDRWLDVYLTSPTWRFTAAAGVCGPAAVIGLMAPSVDRVGRYFPLTIVAELPSHASPIGAAVSAGGFFDRAERLVIETLEAERVDFESFDERVVHLSDDLASLSMPPSVLLQGSAAAVLTEEHEHQWQLPIGAPEQIGSVLERMFSTFLSQMYDPLTLWWTEGSSMVEPSCLIVRGLPHPQSFAALLDGSWSEHHWRPVAGQIEPTRPDTNMVTQDAALRYRSAAATHVGKIRATNQDSFIELPESGLWAVADGLGGHAAGDTASRMVCDAFADFLQTGSFDETVAAACERMHAVNDQLVRAAARSLLADRSGSTVVALLVRDSRCAVLWAGDSRVYRWRSGRLQQLTRDHSVAAAGAAGRAESHAITRAIGAEPNVQLDVCRERARPGDRYLLCTDGLTRVVAEARIAAFMQATDIRDSADGLVKATLDGGAPDNVTALVVETYADVAS